MADLIKAVRDYNVAVSLGIRNKIELANDKLSAVVHRMVDGYHNTQRLLRLATVC